MVSEILCLYPMNKAIRRHLSGWPHPKLPCLGQLFPAPLTSFLKRTTSSPPPAWANRQTYLQMANHFISPFNSAEGLREANQAGYFNYRPVACVLSHFSGVRLLATLWTVAHQASLPMWFSRQEYWSGLPCSPPKDLPNPGTKPASLMSPALAGGFFTTSVTWEAHRLCRFGYKHVAAEKAVL